MRDFIVLAIVLGSAPICLFRPYYGVLLWVWIAYFNPHRFTWSYAYDFPVAMVIAVPTLMGLFFAKEMNRKIMFRMPWLR
jgi:putative inorganic carbon (HCO3(-)) transporter